MKTIFIVGFFFSSYLFALNIEPLELIADLARGNSVKASEYKALHLFDLEASFFEKIKEEVNSIINNNSPSIVQDKTHVTNWTKPFGTALQCSLYNTFGSFKDFSSDHIKPKLNKKFHHNKKYPYLAKLIENLPDLLNMRINVMGPGSGLAQHKEDIFFIHSVTKKPTLRVRFHIPIQTNPLCSMFLQGESYHFSEGKLYFFHNGCVHASENKHKKRSRTHLVFDLLLTERTFKRMFSQESRVSFLLPAKEQKINPFLLTKIDPHYQIQHKTTPFIVSNAATLCPSRWE